MHDAIRYWYYTSVKNLYGINKLDGIFIENETPLRQALFLPVSKKLKAQKTQKISASKKTQGPFWAKNSVCWSQFEISAKKLWNFDHLKPILTDFMVKNETFKDFLIILAQNSCIWGEMFKILKKKPSRFWGKTQRFGKKLNATESLGLSATP